MKSRSKNLLITLIFIFLIFGLDFNRVFITNFRNSSDKRSLYNAYAAKTLLFNETKAYSFIETQLDFGPRVPGLTSHDLCGNWIENQLLPFTDMIITHNFTIQKFGEPSYECQNILGKINPSNDKIVILGAHWDSRNVAEKDEENQEFPIPGANDGASGVAVLLELARVLYEYRESLDCQVWFLFIDAEDQGYSRGMYGLEGWFWAEGSLAFVNDIDNYYNSSTENFDCFILLDMVGGTNLQYIKESRSDEALQNSIFREGNKLGYIYAFPNNAKVMAINDDHIAFHDYGIPVIDLIIDFINGDWTYHHTHSDDLSNIDEKSLEITGKTLESFMKTYFTIDQTKDWKSRNLPVSIQISITLSSILLIGLSVYFLFKRKR